MGKWKYVNWFVTFIILAHMYRYFFVRYEAPLSVYILATSGWLIVGALGYYIFVVKARRSAQVKKSPAVEAQVQRGPVRERPKVAFRKKNENN